MNYKDFQILENDNLGHVKTVDARYMDWKSQVLIKGMSFETFRLLKEQFTIKDNATET